MAGLTPQTKLVKRREPVIDVRLCELGRCPFFNKRHRDDGEIIASCGAGIYQAELPMSVINEIISNNPDPIPGTNADDNPFLLRLLMSPQCVRPECGVAHIEHRERLLLPDPIETEATLFPPQPSTS